MTTPSTSSLGCQGTPLVSRGSFIAGSDRLRMGRGTKLLLLELPGEVNTDAPIDAGLDADLWILLLLEFAGEAV